MTQQYSDPHWGYIAGFETSYAETPTYAVGATGLKLGTLIQDLTQRPPYVRNEWDKYAENDDLEVTYYGGRAHVEATVQFGLLHCIPAYLVMGKSTNTAPSYEQHVIEKSAKTTSIPSMCMYHVMTGASNLVQNAIGCKIAQLDIVGVIGQRVHATAKIIGSRLITGATELTTPPVHPTGYSTKGAYFFGDATFEYPDNTEIPILQNFRITINRHLEKIFTDRSSNSRYCEFLDEGAELTYNVSGSVIASEKSILDDVIDQDNANDLEIKLDRGTNDYAYFLFGDAAPETYYLDIQDTKKGVLGVFSFQAENLTITERNAIVGATYYA